jgi:hypothetical protein
METVKVDMQKLQLLNDRIAQTIDALNQLRLSVHGIQHTPAIGAWGPNVGYGAFSQFGPYGYNPSFVPPYASFGPSFAPQYGSPYATGFQHTSPLISPNWIQPYYSNGLSHATFEPTWQTRTTQTWPVAPIW